VHLWVRTTSIAVVFAVVFLVDTCVIACDPTGAAAAAAAAAAAMYRRGEGSFGILAYGACGYTNEGGALPFPRTQVRALRAVILLLLLLLLLFGGN
jgi:hypothetical protein